MLSRRQFHGRIAASIAACVSTAPTARTEEPAKKKYPHGKFFDFHTHIGPVTNYKPPLLTEELLRWMDANDVAQAAVLPLTSPESAAYPVTTDFVLAETKPFRDRLIPFCTIDPRTDHSGGPRGLLDMFKRYVDAGARGFGEHKTGVAIDDPRNMKLYEACNELKLPVLIHTDPTRNMDAAGLPGFAKVLAAFPKVNFLGHASGWWASVAGGVMDGLMDKYPNLYGDLSGTIGAQTIRRDLKFGREFLIRRADRLVFGTDYHYVGQNVLQFDLFSEIELPADVTQKIFRDNAKRLLRL